MHILVRFIPIPFLFVMVAIVSCDEQPPAFKETLDMPLAVESSDVIAESAAGGPVLNDGVSSLRRSFLATAQKQGTINFSQDGSMLDLYLTMGPGKDSQAIDFQQEERVKITDVYVQGVSELEGMETFLQTPTATGPLDILIVIDNSGSMSEEQSNLSSKLSKLLNYVQDSDWRIAVETTDPKDTCGQYIISKGDANPNAAFFNAITRGTEGSGNERGIIQAVNGLACGGGSWLRANSTIAVLIVSDEDNCSDGTKCNGEPWEYASYLTNYLNSIRVAGVNARVYGLIWHPDSPTCSDALRQGFAYAEAITATNGAYGAICDSDYSSTLLEISKNLNSILQTQFTLAYPAKNGSVEIAIDNQQKLSGYTVAGNVITFDEAPAAGTAIKVSYNYDISGPKAIFEMSYDGQVDDVQVFMDNNLVSADLYKVIDGSQGHYIEFNIPPEGRDIVVQYRPYKEMNRGFSIISGLENGAVKATINGRNEENFKLEGDKVVFDSPPPDGAEIRIEYTMTSGPKLRYPLFIPDEFVQSIDVVDSSTSEAISFTVDSGDIIFTEDSYAEGRIVQITYTNPNPESQLVDVGRNILNDEKVYLVSEGKSCDSYSLEGSVIDYSGCEFDIFASIQASFWYRASIPTRYKALPEELSGEADKLVFKVWINSELVKDYIIEDGWLVFDKPPKEGDRIEIEVASKGFES